MLKSVSIVEEEMNIDWFKNACLIVIQKNSNVTVGEKYKARRVERNGKNVSLMFKMSIALLKIKGS